MSSTGGGTGGLVGSNDASTVSNSFYDTNTSGQWDNDGRGVPETTLWMHTASNFVAASWDFTTLWTTSGDTTYPQFIGRTYAEAPTEIIGFNSISDVDAGIAGSATYADAAAVIAALPTDVTANYGAVSIPVTTWTDDDTYDPNTAESYTFTAVLGTIPPSFSNTGGYTMTVEVVVGV